MMIRTLASSIKRIHRTIPTSGLFFYTSLVPSGSLLSPISSELCQFSWKSTVAHTESQGGVLDEVGADHSHRAPARNTGHDTISEENTRNLTTAEFRKLHHIHIKNEGEGNEYIPLDSFESTPFPKNLKNLLLKQGYTAPTPTQAQSWPIVLANRDIISIARTGSGKVCIILICLIVYLFTHSSGL